MILLLLALACDTGKVSVGSGDLALSFDGAGCAEIPIDDRANGPNMTVEFRLRGSSTHSQGVMPLMFWPGVLVAAELDDGTAWFGAPDIVYGTPYTGALFDDQAHHIAATWTSEGRINLYVDGQNRGFAQATREIAGTTLYLGCWQERDAWLEGAMDEVRLSTVIRYNDSFTPAEEPFEVDEYTAALWHMDEGEGEAILDASRHFDGAVYGVEWVDTAEWNTGEP